MAMWHKWASLALVAASPAVYAQVQINGFLNVVGGYASEREHLRYTAEELSFQPNSAFGLQVSSDVGEHTSVTGQFVTRGSSDFQVEAAWAYMTHRVSDTSAFRAGRFRTPFFLYSDHLDVGYAQHWVTPPREVYALQFDSINGVDFSHQFPIGPLDAKLQLYLGSANDDFVTEANDEELELELREQLGIVGTLNYRWLTVRASFHQVSDFTIANFTEIQLPAPLGSVAGLRAAIATVDDQHGLGPGARYVLNNLQVTDAAVEFAEAAIKLEWTRFFIVGEGSLLTFDHGPLAEQRRHYLSMGTRTGDLTFYGSYARADDAEAELAASLPTIAGVTEGLSAALEGLTSSLMLVSETSTIGLRYDFEPGAAFKVELAENQLPSTEDSYLIRVGYHLIF